MSRFRKVYLQMYGDEKYRRLSPCPPCGQALWWHLIAGKQTGVIPGLFSIGEAAFAEQLKWPLEGFREAFAEVLSEGLAEADWEAPLIWVPNTIRYNTPQSPNVVLSWKGPWEELPQCYLKDKATQALKAFLEGFGEVFYEAFMKVFGDLARARRDKRQETREREKTPPPTPSEGGSAAAAELTPGVFMAAWNAIPGFAHIRGITGERLRHFRARRADPDWLLNWREALARAAKSSFCLGRGERGWIADVEWFLRPTTLTKILEGRYDDRAATNGFHDPNGHTSNGQPSTFAQKQMAANEQFLNRERKVIHCDAN